MQFDPEDAELSAEEKLKKQLKDGAKLRLKKLLTKKKFTKYAKLRLLDGAGALEKEGYRPEQFFFFTGTLPAGTFRAKLMLAYNSRDCVNMLKSYLRRSGVYLTMNCWEFQERRALHLHMVFAVGDSFEDYYRAKVLCDGLVEKWMDMMDRITRKTGVDMYEKEKGGTADRHSKEVVRHCTKAIQCSDKPGSSVIAYLSKYLGKGADGSEEFVKKGKSKGKKSHHPFMYPSSWWSISATLEKLIDKHSMVFSVRLPAEKSVEKFIELSEMLAQKSKLPLLPFSPYFKPDMIFRNIYIDKDQYHKVAEEYEKILGDLRESDGFISGNALLPRNLVLDWLFDAKSGRHREKFMRRYKSGRFLQLFLTYEENPGWLSKRELQAFRDEVVKFKRRLEYEEARYLARKLAGEFTDEMPYGVFDPDIEVTYSEDDNPFDAVYTPSPPIDLLSLYGGHGYHKQDGILYKQMSFSELGRG